MSPRTFDELSRLPYSELRAILRAGEEPADRDAYDEAVVAGQIIDLHHRDEDRAVQAAGEAASAQAAREVKAAERREAQRRRLREGAPFFPRWWIDSRLWGKLRAAGHGIAPVIAALIDPARNFEAITYALIAELAKCSEDTAKRGADQAVALGLIKRQTMPVPGAVPPRSTCFYSLPAPPPVTEAQRCGC